MCVLGEGERGVEEVCKSARAYSYEILTTHPWLQ